MINDILNDIEKIDAICFIHEHRMMNALSELYAKQQMILEYTKNEIAQEFTVFQESVLPEDDDREIHEFVDVPKQRYEVYTDDDDKFESFIMEMFVQEASSTNPTFPDDPNKISIRGNDYMFKGSNLMHTRIAIQMAMCFNISHEVHNNEQGDGISVKLHPTLMPLLQLENAANAFVSAQTAYKKMGKKIYAIHQTLILIQKDTSGIFKWHVVKAYNNGKIVKDITMGKYDKDPGMVIYFDANIPKRAISKTEARAIKALQYIPEIQNKLNSLKNQPVSTHNQKLIKDNTDMLKRYTDYTNKVLKGVNVNKIRREACIDNFNGKYVVSQQLSFHLPRSGSNKATRLNNPSVAGLLNAIENIAQVANRKKEFFNKLHNGIDAAEMIVKVFHIEP